MGFIVSLDYKVIYKGYSMPQEDIMAKLELDFGTHWDESTDIYERGA